MNLPILAAESGFWSSLWPVLVATFFGVVAGLPTALWLNSLATRRERRFSDAQRRQTLSRIVRILRLNLARNAEKAVLLASLIEQGVVPWETPLDVTRWDAIREEFIRSADDAELQDDVAFFFSNVKMNAERIHNYFDFTFGTLSKVGPATEARDTLRGLLPDSLKELEAEARGLDERLQPLEGALHPSES